MKKLIALFVMLFVVCLLMYVTALHAQSQASIGLTNATSLAGCSSVGVNTLCMYGSATAPAAAVSINGGAFVQLGGAVPPPPAGVTSFNTRQGAVMPANGDYGFAQLAGALSATQMPPAQKCTMTLTLSAPAAGNTNTLSGVAQLGGCQ